MANKGNIMTGGCLCGHVSYEIDMDGSRTGNCHCRDCQKNGGGPFMTFTTPKAGGIRWITEPEGRAQASDFAMRRFCARCGTPMTWEHLEKDDAAVSTGTLDEPGDVRIEYEIYTATRWAGIAPLAGIPQYRLSSRDE